MELEKLQEGRREAKVTKKRYSSLDVCVGSIPDSSDGYPQSTYAQIPYRKWLKYVYSTHTHLSIYFKGIFRLFMRHHEQSVPLMPRGRLDLENYRKRRGGGKEERN